MTQTDPLVHLVSDEEARAEAHDIFHLFLDKNKQVPKWMRVMANNPDILTGFFKMFQATMDDSPLPSVLKWKVAKVVSDINKCEFCLDVTDAQLKQFGLSDEEISQIETTASEKERLAIEFAKLATEHAYKIDLEVIQAAKDNFNDIELVELTAVVGLFNYINRFNDALGILPE